MNDRRLIVSADDFGLAPGVDAGIAAAVGAGAVTSVGVMATLADPDAVRALLAGPRPPSIGVHLNLTTGRPLSDPRDVPSLVDPDGRFLPLGTLARRATAARVRRAEVRRELGAQVERLLAAGLPVDHLDSHEHVHLLPGVLAEVVALGRRTGIRRLRSHAVRLIGAGGLGARVAYYRRHPRRLLTHAAKRLLAWRVALGGMCLPDGMVGAALLLDPVAAGPLAEWDAVCAGLPPGTWELVVHPADLDVPGTRDDGVLGDLVERRAAELAALTAPAFRALVARRGVELVPFSVLATADAGLPATAALGSGNVGRA